MKIKTLILTCLTVVWLTGHSVHAQQAPPSLSLAQAAQIAEKKIAAANLPPSNFLRGISLKSLPDGTWCYEAWYQPPVLHGWAGTTPPKEDPYTVEYLKITMDGTASFEKKTITPAAPKAQ